LSTPKTLKTSRKGKTTSLSSFLLGRKQGVDEYVTTVVSEIKSVLTNTYDNWPRIKLTPKRTISGRNRARALTNPQDFNA
jgi:hypothetical protein